MVLAESPKIASQSCGLTPSQWPNLALPLSIPCRGGMRLWLGKSQGWICAHQYWGGRIFALGGRRRWPAWGFARVAVKVQTSDGVSAPRRDPPGGGVAERAGESKGSASWPRFIDSVSRRRWMARSDAIGRCKSCWRTWRRTSLYIYFKSKKKIAFWPSVSTFWQI